MSSKRVLLLTNRVPYPLRDGGAIAMDQMIRAYHAHGWEVYLLGMHTSRHRVDPDTLARRYSFLYRCCWVDTDNEIKPLQLLRNFFFSRLPEHAERFDCLPFRNALREAIGEFRPDVIQAESIYLDVYGDTVRRSGALYVQRLHNVEYRIWEQLAETATNPLKRFYLRSLAGRIRRFEQGVWARADLALPITGKDAEAIAREAPTARLLTTPFGIPCREGVALPDRFDRLYHLGAMDWLPNQEAIDWTARDVWPAVQRQAPGAQFFFGGRNTPERYFGDLPQGMHCVGEVADQQAFAADKHALLVPLRTGSGVRIKILEAMAEGRLVLCTAAAMSGIDAVPDTHYLQADDADSFAAQIARLQEPGFLAQAQSIVRSAAELIRSHYDSDLIFTRLETALEAARQEIGSDSR